MRRKIQVSIFSLTAAIVCCVIPSNGSEPLEEFAVLLERLRKENIGDYGKVVKLAREDRASAMRFLRERFGEKPGGNGAGHKLSDEPVLGHKVAAFAPLPARQEPFRVIETLRVGEFSIDLCRRNDGAFGLGEVRAGKLPLRRADFLITWQVKGQLPRFQERRDTTIILSDPPATLSLLPQTRECAGSTFVGLQLRFDCALEPIVQTSSWELNGSTEDQSYFDGYRGWHAPPQWQSAACVPETNPKLVPSLLSGTGFQFLHRKDGALVHFHSHAGGQLRNTSRGQALEFVNTFHGHGTVDQFIFAVSGDSRINLWTRAYEMVQEELRRAFNVPTRSREIYLQWPPFSREGFRETANQCAAVTAREGFTGAAIDVIWDNADFHGGAKNMNVWNYSICEGYGGEDGLEYLINACRQQNLRVIAWTPAGHLTSASPVWVQNPQWILKNQNGQLFVNPSGGIWHGALDSGFRDYYAGQVAGVVRTFGLDGLWLDSHLAYAQQTAPRDHAMRLAAIYREFIRAGAAQLYVEGDASVFGSYGIGVGDEWVTEWGKVPDPELYYDSSMRCGSIDPHFWRTNFRRYVASGAAWVIDWDFLFSAKLDSDDLDSARRELRQVVRDYRLVKDRMVHRFVHDDGSGYTWTNDNDEAKIVWLLRDSKLADGRWGNAGKTYTVRQN